MDPNLESVPALSPLARDPRLLAFDPQLQASLQSADRRLQSWQRPPNWSPADWSAELRQLENIAACHATATLAPSASAPTPRHISDRIIARVRTPYRREWAYSLHFIASSMEPPPDDFPETAKSPDLRAPESAADIPAYSELHEAIALLSPADGNVINQIFFEGQSETELANALGISQPAVSKKLHRILGQLRQMLPRPLRPAAKNPATPARPNRCL